MAIYTSYFTNYRKFPEGAYTLSIARFNAAYVTVNNHMLYFAPNEDLLQAYNDKHISQQVFEELYKHQLMHIPVGDMVKLIAHIKAMEKQCGNVMLLCYEKTGDYCHRHPLRNYLNAFDSSLNVLELRDPDERIIIGGDDDYPIYEDEIPF
jgi:uncharacterized protein YeaO (DUF488 family)